METTTGLNERQEQFCQEYVQRPVGKWAAARAGYEGRNAASQACRLLARTEIRDRIATLRREVARQHCRDADAILANLQSVFELAMIDHQYNTAINALTRQARIAGLLPGQGTRNAAMTAIQELAAENAPDEAAPDAGPRPMPIEADQSQPDLVSAAETGLPGGTAAAETQDPPRQGESESESDGAPVPKPTDADQSQSIAEIAGAEEAGGETAESPPLPQAPHPDGVAATIPAQMPIDANQSQPISPHAIPKDATIAQWPSGRMRRTRSGRRK